MIRRLFLLTLLLAMSAGAGGEVAIDRLVGPMNEFAAAYNDFAAGMRNGIFDLRQAKRLSKLWRQVEQSGAWPEVQKQF